MNTNLAITSKNRPFRLLTVLDKMIISELFKTIISVLSVLVIIIVSQKFIRILTQAVEGNIANDTVLILLGLKTIIVTASFLPAAIFMAALMVLGRMYREQEMAAIASAGGGLFSLYRSMFLLLVPLSIAALGLSMFSAPWAELKMQQLMNQDKQDADIRGISAGRFSEYSNGELILYTESIDSAGKMQHVFLQNKQGDKTGVVNAGSGYLKMLPGGLYLILEKGERLTGIPGNKDFTIETFDEYAVLIEKKTSVLSLSRQSVASETLLTSEQLADIAEIQNRFNTPLGVLLLAFIAAPLAKLSPRGGIYGSMIAAFGIYFIYGNLQRLNFSWITNASIPAWLGYVWVNGSLLLLGIIMVTRFYGWRWLWQSIKGATQ